MLTVVLTRMSQGPAWLEGLFYDAALAIHAQWRPVSQQDDSSVLVVGLDEASLAHPDLAKRPRALFGPVWAQTLTALRQAGAKVVVFDFILSFSGDALAAGYDREFLRALYQDRGRIVLARSQSLLPARSYAAALGFAPNALGLAELTPDADGVYRRVPLALAAEQKLPTLAGAALAQAGITGFPETVLLAPRLPTDSLPTMPLANVLACGQSNPAALAQAASGKIIFIGTTLLEEDRKPSPSRFFPDKTANAEAGNTQDCAPAQMTLGAGTVPGVYLHALAADMVLGQRLLRLLDPWLRALLAGLAAALTTAIAILLRPAPAIIGITGVCLLLWLGELVALDARIYAAMGYPALLSAVLGGGGFIIRFLFEERRRIHMQKAFGHYLAPELVRRLSEREEMPVLGGETREVSIMFADLSGFTALSSRAPAAEVVALTNQYLSLMAEEIEASHGYIDKYIGDAVMAVWGAPLPDPNHAQQAVRCGQEIARRISDAYRDATQKGAHGFSVKIGINSGSVVAGNVGARNRLNYTVVGDTVNVAARLESVPGDFSCMIVIGEQTAALLGDEIALRELDRIAVKGRDTPLRIFEPVSAAATAHGAAIGYARALALYRDRKFEAAASAWETLAQTGDQPSVVMAKRARQLLLDPPPLDWDGAWHKTAK